MAGYTAHGEKVYVSLWLLNALKTCAEKSFKNGHRNIFKKCLTNFCVEERDEN
jgi:hypothetical protein